jgi:hypothetical protein
VPVGSRLCRRSGGEITIVRMQDTKGQARLAGRVATSRC